MSLALLFHYLMLNMFRMLVHPSSGACDLFVELFHGLYCSGSMCVGVTVWFGWGGVVSLCRLKFQMDVLTFETCWAVNGEILKQVTSSWSIFIQLYNKTLAYYTCATTNAFCGFCRVSADVAWASRSHDARFLLSFWLTKWKIMSVTQCLEIGLCWPTVMGRMSIECWQICK